MMALETKGPTNEDVLPMLLRMPGWCQCTMGPGGDWGEWGYGTTYMEKREKKRNSCPRGVTIVQVSHVFILAWHGMA